MRYLIRDGKIEFCGTISEIINYIKESYEDYYIEEYDKQLEKDFNKLNFVLQNIGLKMSERKPRRKSERVSKRKNERNRS